MLLTQVADAFSRRQPTGQRLPLITAAWIYLLAGLSWLALMVRQLPCRYITGATQPDSFGWMCYSDLTSLYLSRGQATGALPYAAAAWEYPVLTGYFAALANSLTRLFGGLPEQGITGQQMVDNLNIYLAISAVGLFACLLWLIHSQLCFAPDRPWIAAFTALAPAIWTTGLINWDLLTVALTAAGLLAWCRGRPGMAGLWLGLGVAAKLYPIVIIGALIVVWWRRDTRRDLKAILDWWKMLGMALLVWIVVNLPVIISQFKGWSLFYTMNSTRGADLGSIWQALEMAGVGLGDARWWSRLAMVVAYLALALLIFFAKRRPHPLQIAYLAVAIMLVGNLVYSPQYVLWALPLLVLVRPKALDLGVFCVTETIYFAVIWLYLRSNDLTLGLGSTPWVYVGAIFLRVAGSLFLMSRVAADMARGRIEPFSQPNQTSPAISIAMAPAEGQPANSDRSALPAPTTAASRLDRLQATPAG
jgi:hypothetical protein